MGLALFDAMEKYGDRFREAPPMVSLIATEDREAVLILAMKSAIDRGRALSEAEVLKIAGVTKPDGDTPEHPLVF